MPRPLPTGARPPEGRIPIPHMPGALLMKLMASRKRSLAATWSARGLNLWAWADIGEPEPRVWDLTVRDRAPNYRIAVRDGRRYVEAPRDWHRDVTDPDVEETLRLLCSRRPPRAIYAEGVADPNATVPGSLVPLEEWDAEMNRVVGTAWDRETQPALLERTARAPGKRPSP
jgi:hypothetical protein